LSQIIIQGPAFTWILYPFSRPY